MIEGFRDRIKTLSPTWLQDGVAERLMYLIGLGADAVTEKLNQGVKAWLPGVGDPSAIPILCGDRLVYRGLSESDDSIVTRLRRAFSTWQLAGTPRAVMREVLGYLLAFTPASRHVSNAFPLPVFISIWNSYAAGADIVAAPDYAFGFANFDWDSLDPLADVWAARWWRTWLIVYATAPQNWTDIAPFVWGTPGVTWGGTQNSWGLSCHPTVMRDMRTIIGLRKAEHAQMQWIIVSFNDALFDPAAASGGGVNPDGLFHRFSKQVAGQYVPARFADARYCDGVIG